MKLLDSKLNNCFTKNLSISTFLKELENYIENKCTIYYSIDRFEGSFAICENRKTLEMVNITISSLPKNIDKTSILKYKNGNFSIDAIQTIAVKKNIKTKASTLYMQ